VNAESNRFDDFLAEIEAEAQAEGAAAVAELAAFDLRYRLAHELLVRRRQLRLTQAKLAERTGVGQAEISRIEGGRANPTVATLAALARGLGCGVTLTPLAGDAGVRRRVTRRARTLEGAAQAPA
jgi:DNA-binding XRE family transcriptional regulator